MPLLPLQPVLQNRHYPLLLLPQGQPPHLLLQYHEVRLVLPLLPHLPVAKGLGETEGMLLLLLLLLHLAALLHLQCNRQP
jgi:hypothetical protein